MNWVNFEFIFVLKHIYTFCVFIRFREETNRTHIFWKKSQSTHCETQLFIFKNLQSFIDSYALQRYGKPFLTEPWRSKTKHLIPYIEFW